MKNLLIISIVCCVAFGCKSNEEKVKDSVTEFLLNKTSQEYFEPIEWWELQEYKVFVGEDSIELDNYIEAKVYAMMNNETFNRPLDLDSGKMVSEYYIVHRYKVINENGDTGVVGNGFLLNKDFEVLVYSNNPYHSTPSN